MCQMELSRDKKRKLSRSAFISEFSAAVDIEEFRIFKNIIIGFAN